MGVACKLLNLQSPETIDLYYQKGLLFENLVLNELRKYDFNQGMTPQYYFWRDQHGHEVDFIQDLGVDIILGAIKSSMTFRPEYLNGLDWLNKVRQEKGLSPAKGKLFYGGIEEFIIRDYQIYSWKSLGKESF